MSLAAQLATKVLSVIYEVSVERRALTSLCFPEGPEEVNWELGFACVFFFVVVVVVAFFFFFFFFVVFFFFFFFAGKMRFGHWDWESRFLGMGLGFEQIVHWEDRI